MRRIQLLLKNSSSSYTFLEQLILSIHVRTYRPLPFVLAVATFETTHPMLARCLT